MKLHYCNNERLLDYAYPTKFRQSHKSRTQSRYLLARKSKFLRCRIENGQVTAVIHFLECVVWGNKSHNAPRKNASRRQKAPRMRRRQSVDRVATLGHGVFKPLGHIGERRMDEPPRSCLWKPPAVVATDSPAGVAPSAQFTNGRTLG